MSIWIKFCKTASLGMGLVATNKIFFYFLLIGYIVRSNKSGVAVALLIVARKFHEWMVSVARPLAMPLLSLLSMAL